MRTHAYTTFNPQELKPIQIRNCTLGYFLVLESAGFGILRRCPPHGILKHISFGFSRHALNPPFPLQRVSGWRVVLQNCRLVTTANAAAACALILIVKARLCSPYPPRAEAAAARQDFRER